MRKAMLVALFLLFSVGVSYSEENYLLTLKSGRILTWQHYSEQDGQYCTQKASGILCIDKSDVVSVKKKEDDNPTGATTIEHPVADAEKQFDNHNQAVQDGTDNQLESQQQILYRLRGR